MEEELIIGTQLALNRIDGASDGSTHCIALALVSKILMKFMISYEDCTFT